MLQLVILRLLFKLFIVFSNISDAISLVRIRTMYVIINVSMVSFFNYTLYSHQSLVSAVLL